jgi:hypothetical protein
MSHVTELPVNTTEPIDASYTALRLVQVLLLPPGALLHLHLYSGPRRNAAPPERRRIPSTGSSPYSSNPGRTPAPVFHQPALHWHLRRRFQLIRQRPKDNWIWCVQRNRHNRSKLNRGRYIVGGLAGGLIFSLWSLFFAAAKDSFDEDEDLVAPCVHRPANLERPYRSLILLVNPERIHQIGNTPCSECSPKSTQRGENNENSLCQSCQRAGARSSQAESSGIPSDPLGLDRQKRDTLQKKRMPTHRSRSIDVCHHTERFQCHIPWWPEFHKRMDRGPERIGRAERPVVQMDKSKATKTQHSEFDRDSYEL